VSRHFAVLLLRSRIVIPAKAGIHLSAVQAAEEWVPAFAGTTEEDSSPAGYVDRHSGHEIGVAGGQKTDHLGLVRRLGDAAQWRAVDLGLLVFRARLVPARPDALGQGAARRDRLDVDVIGPELKGELTREGDDAAFRRGIGARRRRAEPAPGDRGEIDDLAAALLFHDRHDR